MARKSNRTPKQTTPEHVETASRDASMAELEEAMAELNKHSLPKSAPAVDLITPDNVAMLVSIVGAAVGVTTAGIKGIQLWVEDRKSRKIRVRYKDTEIEISGAVSEAEIIRRLEQFLKFEEEIRSDDVQIEVVDKPSLFWPWRKS